MRDPAHRSRPSLAPASGQLAIAAQKTPPNPGGLNDQIYTFSAGLSWATHEVALGWAVTDGVPCLSSCALSPFVDGGLRAGVREGECRSCKTLDT